LSPVRALAFALSGLIVKFIPDIGRCPMLLLMPFQGLTLRLSGVFHLTKPGLSGENT